MVVSFTLTHCASSLYHSEVFLFHVAIMKNGFPITVTTIIEVISKNYIIKITNYEKDDIDLGMWLPESFGLETWISPNYHLESSQSTAKCRYNMKAKAI